jgi:hypothetical protein
MHWEGTPTSRHKSKFSSNSDHNFHLCTVGRVPRVMQKIAMRENSQLCIFTEASYLDRMSDGTCFLAKWNFRRLYWPLRSNFYLGFRKPKSFNRQLGMKIERRNFSSLQIAT